MTNPDDEARLAAIRGMLTHADIPGATSMLCAEDVRFLLALGDKLRAQVAAFVDAGAVIDRQIRHIAALEEVLRLQVHCAACGSELHRNIEPPFCMDTCRPTDEQVVGFEEAYAAALSAAQDEGT